ncbi:hypothetical protein FB567DRAFT_19562 [Paraphoma chrysanthemicola]|uniref:Uncharacterized protein n=1 Tax=Paraphoma chrysanthemicola TaxID=798071 RepID=A0A8K0W487_9PLEO|nr:hypothetical protein FB567DRAFT_19562 [Paraphoma chrysanthemicola]
MAVKLDQKAHKAEEAEVSHCVSNLIQAFSNGFNVFKRLRERRRKKKARKENQVADAVTSDELQLSKSLRRGPQELAENYDTFYSQTGPRFAQGDAIAHASLAETLIKLNTGLVAIIASFLNHDQKGSKSPLNIDYKSLTNLSDASRKEALRSMTQLYQRLSESQLQLHQLSQPCAKCGSKKHADCSSKSSTSSSKDKRKHAQTRHRPTGPTITRMPLKSSTHPQLVVVRPKATRKSSTSSSSSSKSSSPQTSAYTSPLASPLPLYIAESPFEIETNGIIHGVLGGPTPPLAGSGRRRKDSFNVHDPRPTTWPEHMKYQPQYQYPYVQQDHLHLPAPKLPTFTPTPRKPSSGQHAHHNSHKKDTQASSLPKAPSPPPPQPLPLLQPKHSPPPPPVASSPTRRRLDKITPSAYTFASDSTKLGEIPMRNWTEKWDWEEAERLNNEAALMGNGGVEEGKGARGDKEREGRDGKGKKGLFRWMRRGDGGVVVA